VTPPPPTAHAGLARRRLLGWSGAAAAALAVPSARAQFRIEVSGVGATQLPIAVATLRAVGEPPPVDVAAVVRANLDRSGVFRSVSPPAAIDETVSPNLPDWRAQGVDALVAGTVQRGGDGRFEVRYKLWDAVRNEELLGRSRLVLAADLRLAAHRIADEIHEKLTGERAVNATRIAYVLRQGRRYTLNITDADGENGQVALASGEAIISPAWAPDGRQIAYVSFETGKAVVWIQDLLTGQRRMVANFRGSNSAPAFAPDGRTLAVALSQAGLTQLHSVPAAGGPATRLTTSNAIDTEPVWSADGRFIYFVSDRGGGPQIYRIDASGGNATRITFEGDYNISPSLSPDGRLLAYIGRQGSAFRLMTQELDGGSVRTLTDTRDDERPSFAPNGRLIVYATRMQGTDTLMTTTLDGKIKTRLATSGADMREPAWGPFGLPDPVARR
jgi:TolB protein